MMSTAVQGMPTARARAEFPGWRATVASALLVITALYFVAIRITHAEEPEVEAEAPYVDHIVVTGTRITRRDYESASPIVTVMPELFESVGAPTVEDALNRLPQLVPNFSSTSTTRATMARPSSTCAAWGRRPRSCCSTAGG